MKKNNRRLLLWIGGICVYVLALVLLTLAESADPNASIQSLADAFWYSLVTMSTVGYGDMYPVTAVGKALGAVFVLLSLGLLTFVITLMIKLVTGKMLPAIRLWSLRNKPWFLFSCSGEKTQALAENLRRLYPNGVFVLSGEDTAEGFLTCPGSIESLAAGKKSECSLFYMDGEYERALQGLSSGHPVYCLTDFAPDAVPEGLTLFDSCDCCAQAYWQKFGLEEKERQILILGSGTYAEKILLRGLLQNVIWPGQQIHYHVFGAWDDFLRNHYRLADAVAVNENMPNRDSVFVHANWNADSRLLAKADRIILCAEDAEENRRILGMLRTYFPTKAKIHLRGESGVAGETVFGRLDEIFTAELVMHQQRTLTARTMHEIYCASAGGNGPAWEELSEFLRQSNIAAADHLLTKIRILLGSGIDSVTPENCRRAYENYQKTREEKRECYRWIEHERWMRFHSLHNWEYAPMRDNTGRKHPMLRPYEQLDAKEQEKDDYAWELLDMIAQKI